MGISPISGIRAIPAIKPGRPDREVTSLLEIEGAVEPGDDTWTRGGKNADGAEEDIDELNDSSENEEKAPVPGPAGNSNSEDTATRISLLA